MGQKINPNLFRSCPNSIKKSSWFVQDNNYSHFLAQNTEIHAFLENLFKARGIFLRSCSILRSSAVLIIKADLYFSYILAKESKFFWAKSFFKTIEKKYSRINRMKDIKNFVLSLESYGYLNDNGTIFVYTNESKSVKIPYFIKKRNKFFYFLLSKTPPNYVRAKGKHSFFSAPKKVSRAIKKKDQILKFDLLKFTKLFSLNKLNYTFQKLSLSNCFEFFPEKTTTLSLSRLNRNICKSLQKFTGVEELRLEFSCQQLSHLAGFKFYKRRLLKDLFSFYRNKDFSKYFFESLELIYFTVITFGYGNASLVAKLLIHLLEKNRKHLTSVKFLQKALSIFFTSIPKNIRAIEGIKIQIKGRFNKRRRTKKIIIQEGLISLQTIDTPLDYFQTSATTLYGSFGIKIWISKISLNQI